MKTIMMLFGFVTVFGLILMMGSYTMTETGSYILVPIEGFGGSSLPPVMTPGKAYEYPILTPQPSIAEGEIPKEMLIPVEIEFYVNRIMVPPEMITAFIPIKKWDLNTFSGRFGPYDFDPRQYIGVKLCSYPKNFPNMLNCETVATNFANGYVHFARGYAEDEFIARQALKNFGAIYFIVSPAYGNIAKSNPAILKLIEHY